MAMASSSLLHVLLLLLWLMYQQEGSFAAPVLAPNIAICQAGSNTQSSETLDCCAPSSQDPAREFEFAEVKVRRVRRAAHNMSEEYANKLSKAYALMRALPETDPRSYGHQANIHCAYCNEFYTQPNSTVPLQIHGSWLFFSFHRWYLYFHERILAKLLGDDDSFALPFWNYDHPDGSTMPRIFVEFPELRDEYRQPSHYPPAVVAIDALNLDRADRTSAADQLAVNRAAFYWAMISGAETQYGFFGQPYRAGDYQMPGYGTVESMPHNAVHAWTGDLSNGFHDMGDFSTSARDPIFYAHHANLDRLWSVWKSLSLNNTDIDDPDYLDSEFVFYDENAQLVKVKVRDSLDAAKLGYEYEEVDNPWLDIVTSAQSYGVAKLSQDAVMCSLQGKPLMQACSLEVGRDLQSIKPPFRDHHETAAAAEVLVIGGIQVDKNNTPAYFNVFVNLPSANASTPLNCTEFAGAFSTLVPTQLASVHLHIGNNVQKLNLTAETSLVITLVPATQSLGVINISSVEIVCESETQHSMLQM